MARIFLYILSRSKRLGRLGSAFCRRVRSTSVVAAPVMLGHAFGILVRQASFEFFTVPVTTSRAKVVRMLASSPVVMRRMSLPFLLAATVLKRKARITGE